MTDTDAVQLDPDGPHSPERTRRLANVIRDAVRALNHATQPMNRYPGLEFPLDVYEVLGALTPGAHGLTQLFDQLGDWLERELQAGRIAINYGKYHGDPVGAVSDAMDALQDAVAAAGQLHDAVNRAWNATSGMSATAGEDNH